MTRGRPQLPDAIHQLRGTYRPDRHGDPDSKVKASKSEPKLPKEFGKARTRLWVALKRELQPLGLWSSSFAIECEMLVRVFHRVRQLEADIDEKGPIHEVPKLDKDGDPRTFQDENGRYVVIMERRSNPAIREMAKQTALLHQLCSTLGLNPSSLSKLQIEPSDDGDDLDDDGELRPTG